MDGWIDGWMDGYKGPDPMGALGPVPPPPPPPVRTLVTFLLCKTIFLTLFQTSKIKPIHGWMDGSMGGWIDG